MDIKQATGEYEAWLAQRMPLIEADLRLKHQRMAQEPFAFLRATFYRWIQTWPQVCPELVQAPSVLGVGDLHVENFGTWRDAEGRLVWGVNDFDEACQLPYTNDLVRLAASALLAIDQNHLSCAAKPACAAIIEGFSSWLAEGGRPIVLAERHPWLRELAKSELRDPQPFWEKLQRWRNVEHLVPADIKKTLRDALPEHNLPFKVVHRQAGLGSLGRRRFTALAEWRGGMIAREAKELTLSAWHWQGAKASNASLHYARIIGQAVRVADPFLQFHKHWLIRRLAPDCSRVELASVPLEKAELKLLRAMGRETANVHLGTKGMKSKILLDLRKRPSNWLQKAAVAMMKSTMADWQAWRSK